MFYLWFFGFLVVKESKDAGLAITRNPADLPAFKK
jgi:hypothetical protein